MSRHKFCPYHAFKNFTCLFFFFLLLKSNLTIAGSEKESTQVFFAYERVQQRKEKLSLPEQVPICN